MSNPTSNRPATPNTPPYNPQVSAPPASPAAPIDRTTTPGATGTGMTPGAANSGSGAGGRETMTPTPSATQNTNDLPKGAAAGGAPGTAHFNTVDVDRDGRISQAEFMAPSASWLRKGPSPTGVSNSGGVAGGNPGAASTPGAPDSSAPGSKSATGNTQLFQQVDTNHDGYLSRAEVDAYRTMKPSER